MNPKRCSKCGEEKDVEFFYHDRKEKGGHTRWCKNCMNAVGQKKAEEKRAKLEAKWMAPVGMKICRKCLTLKPDSDFNRHDYTKDKLRNECKECQKIHAHDHYKEVAPLERVKRKIHYHANKRAFHHWHLQKNFKISVEDYERMFKDQDGKCSICGSEKPYPNPRIKNFAVDHDHETGKIRGLLCVSCNVGIGHFRHDPSLLQKAIDYLHREPPHCRARLLIWGRWVSKIRNRPPNHAFPRLTAPFQVSRVSEGKL